jgi:hypothetical protein
MHSMVSYGRVAMLPRYLTTIVLAMLVLPARHMDIDKFAVLRPVCREYDAFRLGHANLGLEICVLAAQIRLQPLPNMSVILWPISLSMPP